MDIAAGHGNHARRHAPARFLHRARVRAAEGQHLALGRDAVFRRKPLHQLDHGGRADQRAVHDLDRRALAQLYRELRLHLRHVARARHVDGDAHVRPGRVGRRRCAGHADLLLHGEYGDDLVLRLFAQLQQRLRLDVAADAVVHRRRGKPVLAQPGHARLHHAHVADGHHLKRLLAALRADIDVKIGDLRRALDLLVREHHAAHAVFKHDVAAHHRLGVDAADAAHAQIAVLVRVRHRQADMIHVRGEHDAPARAVAVPDRDQVAHHVGADFVHMAVKRFADNLRHAALVAGRAVGGQNLFQKLHVHGCSLLASNSPSTASVSACAASISLSLHTLAGL